MDIIATRGSFGDFGRVTKGQIIKNVSNGQAKKLIDGGTFAEATPAAIKAAETHAKAKAKALAGKHSSSEGNKSGAALQELQTAVQSIGTALADFKAKIDAELAALKSAPAEQPVSADAFAALKAEVSKIGDRLAAMAAPDAKGKAKPE